ncbi:SHOCT domain-containing protein [Blastococcus sp. SYSU D01042]
MRRFLAGLLVLVSAISLVLASTSLWTRQNVVDTDAFVQTVEDVADLPEVEARVTQRVTETVMDNPEVQQAVDDALTALPEGLQRFRPTVENGIRTLVATGVARLLTNDPFRPLTTAAVTSAHEQLVSGEAVEFTLGQAKERVPESLQDGIAGQVLELLPDDVGVTLLSPAESPEIYDAIDLLESVWWWLGLLALACLAGALGVSRRGRGTLRAWAVTTVVLGCLVLVTLRLARGRVVAGARPDNRDALGAVYDLVAGSLRVWTLWLVACALLVVVATLVWGRLGFVAGVRHATAAARRSMAERRAASAPAASADGAPAVVATGSWGQRVAAATRAFVDSLDLRSRASGLGATVRSRYGPARWTGIALGAVLLLMWPDPTLSVLVWIVALVVLYLWALDWLRDQAPAPQDSAAADVAGLPARAEGQPSVPVPRPLPHGDTDEPAAPPSLTPAVLTPQALAVLNERLDLLVRLGAAHDSGVLTDQEYDREKRRLMSV